MIIYLTKFQLQGVFEYNGLRPIYQVLYKEYLLEQVFIILI